MICTSLCEAVNGTYHQQSNINKLFSQGYVFDSTLLNPNYLDESIGRSHLITSR